MHTRKRRVAVEVGQTAVDTHADPLEGTPSWPPYSWVSLTMSNQHKLRGP
jgi:hypothetical protein